MFGLQKYMHKFVGEGFRYPPHSSPIIANSSCEREVYLIEIPPPPRLGMY